MIDTTCLQCGQAFRTWPYKLRDGRGKYCSNPCFNAAQTGVSREKVRTLEERFWEKVDKRSPDECWPWLGSKTDQGYGGIGHNGRVRKATHVSWELHNERPWPEGKLACHTCDNPPCVNPLHLFVGTKQDNANDMAAKGRSVKGLHRQYCRNGHLRTAENTYTFARDGSVQCRVCRRALEAQRRVKQPGDLVI